MILAIVGSRDYPWPDLVRRYVSRIPPGAVSAIYSGGARGVDTWAVEAARYAGIQVVELLADWEHHGKRAGFIRNQELVDAVDQVVAFWDGQSRGTRHTIGLAFDAGKLRRVFGPDGRR